MDDSQTLGEKRRLAILEENRRIGWLRIESDVVRAVLYQDRSLTLQQARELVYNFRKKVLEVFPGKEATFDLILLPRYDRVIRERWGEPLDQKTN